MRPIDAFKKALNAVLCCELLGLKGKPKPGEIIGLLKSDERESLKKLTSNDANKVWFEPWRIKMWYDCCSSEKKEFDQKIYRN